MDKFIRAARSRDLVNVATDGETYGHHFKFGDLCLAHALRLKRSALVLDHELWRVSRSSSAGVEVEIDNGPEGEGTSWSCVHGVGVGRGIVVVTLAVSLVGNQSWRGRCAQR